jgi:YhcH/YjgK/YiaL family protein
MIFDTLDNRKRYERLGFRIERGLAFLAATDWNAIEDGRHAVEGDEIFVLIMSYETEPEEKRSFEAHRKYIDIQYLVSGRELICWAPLEELEPAGEYSVEKDIVFLSGAQRARLLLKPGTFALFFPQDAHRPNCAWNKPERTRKAVVKVRIG